MLAQQNIEREACWGFPSIPNRVVEPDEKEEGWIEVDSSCIEAGATH